MESAEIKLAKKQKDSRLKMDALKWLSHIQLHSANRLASRESCWFWIPSMILLLVFASILLHLIITRYVSNPTFMLEIDSINTRLAFPSIIIYPAVSFRTYKKNEFLANIKYPMDLNQSYVQRVLPQLAAFFSPDVPYIISDLENLERLLRYNDMDVESAGKRLTETCEDILIRCRWRQLLDNCSDLFHMELARDGFCCVFNGRSLRRELQENIVINKKTPVQFAYKVGFNSGLMVAINQSQKPLNIDLSYKWIVLQAGQRFVDPSLNGTALNPGTEQWISYNIQKVYITEAARQLGAFLRRCVMSHDELTHFPVYRKKYCLLECEIARTIKQCGCVRWTHPRPPGVNYCAASRLACALRTSVSAESCQCPPTCDVNTAFTRIKSFHLDRTVPTIDKFYNGLDYSKMTVVRAFIDKRKTRSKERGSFFSFVDLFSQLGGMFNMFFGCSILTMLGLIQLGWKITLGLWIRFLNKLPRMKKRNLTQN